MPWVMKLSRGDKIYLDSEEDANSIKEKIEDPNCADFFSYKNEMIKRSNIMRVYFEGNAEEPEDIIKKEHSEELADKYASFNEEWKNYIADFILLNPEEKADKMINNFIRTYWLLRSGKDIIPEVENIKIKKLLTDFFTKNPAAYHISFDVYKELLPSKKLIEKQVGMERVGSILIKAVEKNQQ